MPWSRCWPTPSKSGSEHRRRSGPRCSQPMGRSLDALIEPAAVPPSTLCAVGMPQSGSAKLPVPMVSRTSGHPEREAHGDVVKWFNTEVCKTSIHRFESGRRLHTPEHDQPADRSAGLSFVGGSACRRASLAVGRDRDCQGDDRASTVSPKRLTRPGSRSIPAARRPDRLGPDSGPGDWRLRRRARSAATGTQIGGSHGHPAGAATATPRADGAHRMASSRLTGERSDV
jgi:hypothetical protein